MNHFRKYCIFYNYFRSWGLAGGGARVCVRHHWKKYTFLFSGQFSPFIGAFFSIWNTSTRPKVRGTADGGAYSPFRSILLVLTHDFIITCVYGPTDMNGNTRTLRCAPFLCRLRQMKCCMLGAPSSQPTVPLHELPPARLVIHRQTSAHERRKGTLSVQSRSGILADFCPRHH